MARTEDKSKLERFLEWLQVNGVELRGCDIKYSDSSKGFGIFSTSDTSDGVLLVVPLDLAITPMRVLQDPLLGPECRAMFEEGEVDDRFLMVLFLTLERLRKNSSWKPYLDTLPTSFGNPLWFSDDELLELKGTALYRATELQKKSLIRLYDDKVKGLVKKLLVLDGDTESEVCFEDFLWANSIFWSRALNIPLPRSYVFLESQEDQDNCSADYISSTELANRCQAEKYSSEAKGGISTSQGETMWVEGLVPGIDFCNHGIKAVATWEVDGTGSVTGVRSSMYLISANQIPFGTEKEISISYGNKGNEELLYLYGFVIDNNPDDYLMVHYPVEAVQSISFSESKAQLLEAQKAELRCLLPRGLLDYGFDPSGKMNDKKDAGKTKINKSSNLSWCGQRKTPSYIDKLVFPENFLAALRTIAMQEEELFKVSSLLEELVGTEGDRQPSESEVRAAVWEACGDSGALQLLIDLLQVKMINLKENSGTEDDDANLLQKFQTTDNIPQNTADRIRWSCIVYRRGQKELTRLFLKEADQALQLALREGN